MIRWQLALSADSYQLFVKIPKVAGWQMVKPEHCITGNRL